MLLNWIKPLLGSFLLVISLAAQAATITVTTLADQDVDNAACSLREAIIASNSNAAYNGCVAGSGVDTIDFGGNGTIVLTANLPKLTAGANIIGPGASKLTIDGDEQFRMFDLGYNAASPDYLLQGLTLMDGASATSGAPALHFDPNTHVVLEDSVIRGMRKTVAGTSGAIYGTTATLIVRRTTFFDNSTFDGSGGVVYAFVGLVVIFEDSLFLGNSTNGATADGGAIAVANGSDVTVRRCTFSGNSASDDGGAIAVFGPASLFVESSTFIGNSAATTGGALILNNGTTKIGNSIFALNQITPPPVSGKPKSNINFLGSAVLISQGFNFIGDNEGSATAFPSGNPNANGDTVGTTAAPIDPMLAALQDNGGPTRTHRIQAGSPLIDQGSCTGEPYDQRQFGNPVTGSRIIDMLGVSNADDGCDIGAFELGAQPLGPIFLDGFESPNF